MTENDFEKAVDTIVRGITPHKEKLSTQACRAEQCAIIYKAILAGTVSLDAATEAAMGGDPYMDRALRQVARECLAAGILPEPIGRFLDYVLGASGPANFPKGQHSMNFWSRNGTIRMLVEETKTQWGLNATRNEATEGPAAATIVAEALQRCGMEIKEKRIVEIYTNAS